MSRPWLAPRRPSRSSFSPSRSVSRPTANTVILVTSSFAFACAVAFARLEAWRRVVQAAVVTAMLGAGFLALKGLEWWKDIEAHDLPGVHFAVSSGDGGG